MRPIAFDRVVMDGPDGVPVVYSLAEFLALPLNERIDRVMKRNVTFFRGNVQIDRADALRSLRTWSIPPKGGA